MSDTEMRQWVEPDPEVLGVLTNWGMYAAGRAQIDALSRPSSIPGPDGQPQPLTPNEMCEVGVRAALRLLLANGFIEAHLPDDNIWFNLDAPPPESGL
jgi:hypothetical protein